MCGILAVVDPAGAGPLDAALATLAPRGPDGRGTWTSENGTVGLGHTRLAILDIEGGAQPLANEDGTLHAVVNGELYDHDRIRAELAERGHRLATASDSEILLHLYEEHGLEALNHLRGQFAFALYDGRRDELLVARDRFGMKPVFWSHERGRLVVGSEVRALHAAGVPRAWDHEAVHAALHFAQRYDESLFRGVRQLPPGHVLRLARGRVSVRPYWRADYPRRASEDRGLDAVAETREIGALLREAVRLRTRADVPIGCYLSGGVDSSTVLGLARATSDRDVLAFSIAFDHPDYDETDVAGEMARSAGASFERIPVTAEDFAGVFDASVERGETFAYNGHVPARFILSRAVQRAGIKTVLGGEGADELFGGYAFASGTTGARGRRGPLATALRFALPPDRAPGTLGSVSPMLGRLARAIPFPTALVQRAESALAEHRSLLDPDFVREHRHIDPFRRLLRTLDRGAWIGRHPYKVVMPLWLRSHFVNYLMAADRIDMAHGVEVRLPFLDHVLFERVRELPTEHLGRHGRNKDLLRRIAAPWVTPRVLEGAKRPFLAPPGTPGDALFEHLRAIVYDRSFQDVPFLDARGVRSLIDRFDRLPFDVQRTRMPLLYIAASAGVLQRAVVRDRSSTTP